MLRFLNVRQLPLSKEGLKPTLAGNPRFCSRLYLCLPCSFVSVQTRQLVKIVIPIFPS